MKIINSIFLLAFLMLANFSVGQDVQGSKDHPLITRYPGSVIGYFEEQQYRPYFIATGPVRPAIDTLINGWKRKENLPDILYRKGTNYT